MSKNITAGIDIGSNSIRVVAVETRGKGAGLHVVGMGSAESRGIRNGYIVHLEEATRGIKDALGQLEKTTGTPIRRALVSLGGVSLESTMASGSVIISRIDGTVTETDIERAIEAAETSINLSNKKIIHRFPLKFRIDNKDILGRPQGMQGTKLEIKMLFVTSFNQHLDDMIAAVENAGVDVDDVVASPLAASVVTLSKAQRTAGCVLANIGAETVSIAVFEDEQLLSLEVLPVGGSNITNDIALGLKIPLEEAEALKTGTTQTASVEFPQKQLEEIIDARLRDIFHLVRAHLKKIGKNELLPAGIILTGGGLGVQSIEDVARCSLSLPARIAVLDHIVLPERGDGSDEKEYEHVDLPTAWSVAYGLCLLGSDGYYTSDFFEYNRVKIRKKLSSILAWLKQFSP